MIKNFCGKRSELKKIHLTHNISYSPTAADNMWQMAVLRTEGGSHKGNANFPETTSSGHSSRAISIGRPASIPLLDDDDDDPPPVPISSKIIQRAVSHARDAAIEAPTSSTRPRPRPKKYVGSCSEDLSSNNNYSRSTIPSTLDSPAPVRRSARQPRAQVRVPSVDQDEV